jgi:hypothetical protein
MRLGKTMCRPLTAGILILALVAQFGCASGGTGEMSTPALLPSPSREAFQGLGTVAVTSGRFAPEFEYEESSQSEGSVGGALKGALEGFFAPLQLGAAGTPLILPVIAVLMPVGLVGGLLHGAGLLSGGKGEERAAREATVRELVASQRLQDDLRDRVVAIGRAQTHHTFTVLADRGPSAVGEQPDYSSLSKEGIQMVMEVVVGSVKVKDEVLGMTVNRRLVRTVDNAELYAKRNPAEWVFRSESLKVDADWAYAEIAERTVKEIFPRTESN